MRGKKASVYEGGHRVPFLSWWPKGTHQSLWGTNFDLPVSQIDFFATFAEILNYPLPNGDQVIQSIYFNKKIKIDFSAFMLKIAKRTRRSGALR